LDPQKFFTEMSLLESVFQRRREVNYLKFLYDPYLPQYYWTEVMECFRKLLLTGFVVFFYEGSSLQILTGLTFSVLFFGIYSYLQPYLLPSNNGFAAYVHFQVAFTLLCSFGLRMIEITSDEFKESIQFSSQTLSFALLASNASVLFVGIMFILKAVFVPTDKERDFIIDSHNKNKGVVTPINQDNSSASQEKNPPVADGPFRDSAKKKRKRKKPIKKEEIEGNQIQMTDIKTPASLQGNLEI